MNEETARYATWAGSLKKLSLETALPDIESTITHILDNCKDPNELLEIAEAIRAGIRLNTTTADGINLLEDAIAYLHLLDLDKKLYEKIILLAGELNHEGLALAIHRNLATLIHAQQIRYQHYLPIPEVEWMRIHRLFYISVENKLTGYSPIDKIYYPAKPLSILNQYCMALLLGCGRLNHLTPLEMSSVNRSLLTWCSLVGISRKPAANSEHQLVVDITSGSAPNFRKLFSPSETSISCYLQVDQLIAKLDSLLPKEEAPAKPGAPKPPPPAFIANNKELTHDTIRHLKSAWSEYIYREERLPADETIRVCIGVDTIFFHLCGQQVLKDFIGAKIGLSIVYDDHEDKTVIEKQRSGDVWSAFLSAPDGILVKGDIPAEFNFQRYFPRKNAVDNDISGSTHPVQMKDTSSRGCRLHWGKHSSHAPAIGTLLGLSKDNFEGHWQIGEIAWKDLTPDDEVITGIRLLSTCAIPVALDIPLRLARNQNYAEGILMPPESALGTSTVSFLVHPMGLKQGEYVTISQKGIEEKIQLTQTIKVNDTYEYYDCAFVVKKPSLTVERPK